jgi:CheY-like chemotaxis protein
MTVRSFPLPSPRFPNDNGPSLCRENGKDSFPTRVESSQHKKSKLILTTLTSGGPGGSARLAGSGFSPAEGNRSRTEKRILLVSADSNLRSLMRSFLEHADFDVVNCADASRAAQACATGLEPDLLLVDLHLLGQSGLDLALSLCADRAGLPVVALYGADTDAELISLARQRRWRVLMKPFLVTDLLTKVCSALDSARDYVPTDAARQTSVPRKAVLPCGATSTDHATQNSPNLPETPHLRDGTEAWR